MGPTLAVPLHGLRGTFSTHTGTAYSGLRCARREFDQVASLRVEGVSISATARVTGHARNTIARWLERASTAAKRVNQRMLRDCEIIELPADALCTFIGTKSRAPWLCAAIEVCSRLWAGSVLGRRASRNATAVLNDVLKALIESGGPFELVDVRTDEEREFAKIDGSRLLDQSYHDALRRLDPKTPIVFQCHHGGRSQQAAEYFRREGFRNLYNLRGGIDAWSQFVDPSVPRY